MADARSYRGDPSEKIKQLNSSTRGRNSGVLIFAPIGCDERVVLQNKLALFLYVINWFRVEGFARFVFQRRH